MSTIAVVGVPSSAASYAAGQDLAPTALRSAGLLEELSAAGLEVRDDGDLPRQVWKPDRDHPLAQNADEAAGSLRQLSGRLEPLLARGDFALVLGGNCIIALGIMAALRRLGPAAPGLLYVDRHYEIRGYERCRSASSTRPAAPGTPPRYPVLPAASPAYSPSRRIRPAKAPSGLSSGGPVTV